MTENAVQEAGFPKTDLPHIKEQLKFQPDWGWAFVFCFLILALKNGLAELFFPLLYNEDGRNLFAVFYNDHSLKNVFISYAGYVRVFPNGIAYLIHFFPITWIPALYALASLAFTAFTYSLVYPLLKRIWQDKYFALYAVVLLAALPLASFKMVGTLMFQVWHCNMALFILAFLPLPRPAWQKFLYLIFVHILIWSHPYTILILPVYLYHWMVQKQNRLEYGMFAVSVTVYFVLALKHHPLNWESLQYFPSSLLGRVATEAVVGPLNRAWFQYLEISYPFGLLALALVGGLAGYAWKTMPHRERWFYLLGLYFLISSLAVALLGRDLGDYYHLINGSPRYTYLPRLAFLMLLLAALYRLYRVSALFRKTHWAAAALVLALNAPSNIVYETDRKVGESVRDYVAFLDQTTYQCAPGEQRWFTLHRGDWKHPGTPPDWSFAANLCRH